MYGSSGSFGDGSMYGLLPSGHPTYRAAVDVPVSAVEERYVRRVGRHDLLERLHERS